VQGSKRHGGSNAMVEQGFEYVTEMDSTDAEDLFFQKII
jgi:hypothetical protein